MIETFQTMTLKDILTLLAQALLPLTTGMAIAQTPADSLIPNSASRADPLLRPIVVRPHPFLLPIARTSVRGSYPIELSFTKTTHIVFPARILDFDAGSEDIMAMVPETLLNVLRVKADSRGFVGETNMTVFTEDGKLYSFLVRYNDHPVVFTVDMAQNRLSDAQAAHALGIDPGSDRSAYLLPEGIFSSEELRSTAKIVLSQRDFIRRVGGRNEDFSVRVKGLFLDQRQVLYLKMEMKNRSYMPYRIDFIRLYVRDKRTLKRTAVQQQQVSVISTHPGVTHLHGAQAIEQVLAIPYKTLSEGKVLEVEVYEKNGGRHVTFPLTNETLLKVKPIF